MTTAVVPAAGLGSRLGCDGPKALVDLQGTSLMGHVLRQVDSSVDRLVLVVRPGLKPLFEDEIERIGWTKPVSFVVQREQTGSADAVALGLAEVPDDDACIVVWADQVGVSRKTIGAVAALLRETPTSLVLPLVRTTAPYVWFEVAEHGAIDEVHRVRDGDVPDGPGWSDVGVFGLPAAAARSCIDASFSDNRWRGRERDFVYVLPLLAETCGMRTVAVDDALEAFGVNSRADLDRAAVLFGGVRR